MPRKSWWARLPFGVRMTAGTCALLAAVGGGVAGVAALTGGGQERLGPVSAPAEPTAKINPEFPVRAEPPPTPTRSAPPPPVSGGRRHAAAPMPAATRTSTPPPARTAGPLAAAPRPPVPVVTTRTEVETRDIPYDTQVVQDASLPEGAQRVQVPGAYGQETLRFLVTLTNGQPTDRRLIDSTVTRPPQPRVVVSGTRQPAGGGPHRPDCRRALNFCVPLGRGAVCRQPLAAPEPGTTPAPDTPLRPKSAAAPDTAPRPENAQAPDTAPRPESILPAGTEVDVLDQDLLHGGDPDGFGCRVQR